MAADPTRICPFLTMAASPNLNPEAMAKGIMIVYASCSPNCMLFVPNKVTLPGAPSGTCGLSREPQMMLKGSLN